MLKYLRSICIMLLCFAGQTSFSQITFVKGYLINDKGDTLKGEVKINPKKEHELYSKVFFKDESGAQKNYKPNKVKGYGINNEHFVSISQDEEALFYKRLTNGAIILYKTSFETVNMNETIHDHMWYLSKEGDKKLTEVREGKFRKQLSEWMKDNQELANSFKDEKEFNEAAAIETITKYNDWKKSN